MTSERDDEYACVVDARKIDGEPFTGSTAALDALDVGESMPRIDSFEPEPLYDVLSNRGLSFDTSRTDEDEWHVEMAHG